MCADNASALKTVTSVCTSEWCTCRSEKEEQSPSTWIQELNSSALKHSGSCRELVYVLDTPASDVTYVHLSFQNTIKTSLQWVQTCKITVTTSGHNQCIWSGSLTTYDVSCAMWKSTSLKWRHYTTLARWCRLSPLSTKKALWLSITRAGFLIEIYHSRLAKYAGRNKLHRPAKSGWLDVFRNATCIIINKLIFHEFRRSSLTVLLQAVHWRLPPHLG